MPDRIVILGAGPTGLGAGYRLQELGYGHWEIFEKNPYVGGLAASFKDDKGFTWDLGGHVLFSHYDYVAELANHICWIGGPICRWALNDSRIDKGADICLRPS